MEIAIGIAGLIIALVTFKYSFFKKPVEELEHLKIQFKVNQKLSLKVQSDLSNYISQNNCSSELINDRMTFSEYQTFLEDNHKSNLSEEVYVKINNKFTKTIIDSMIESLNNQFVKYQDIENELKVLFSKIKN